MKEEKYMLALHALESIGSRRMFMLYEYYGNFEKAYKDVENWYKVFKIGKDEFKTLMQEQASFPIDGYYDKFIESKAQVVYYYDEAYPENLKNIDNPPFLLFCLGHVELLKTLGIAMVGTRTPTDYGAQVANDVAFDLASSGYTIISGMARGIDTQAHLGTIRAGGNTIAVLGCGVNIIYPAESQRMYHNICRDGLVISEFPLDMPAIAHNFPYRNRIISGLAEAIVVVEAAVRSGTQITVNTGVNQGKEIFAFPGPIMSHVSVGTHEMIRSGIARLVTSAEEILSDLNFGAIYQFGKAIAGSTIEENIEEDEELAQIRALMTTPRHLNDLMREMNMNISDTIAKLMIWEMRGYIKQLPGEYFIIDK